jgi:hypothetical protein
MVKDNALTLPAQGDSMRLVFIALLFFVAAITAAGATTYSYVSNGELTTCDLSEYCPFSTGPASLTGQITLGLDTSHFSGNYSLGLGDIATFPGFSFGDVFSFPATPIYFGPPGGQGLQDDFTSYFTFQNGSIVNWSIISTLTPINCGLGPACSYGGSLNLSTGHDQVSEGAYPVSWDYEGSGLWTIQTSVASVPEISTWAMMLIGLAGIGSAAVYQKKRLQHFPVTRDHFVRARIYANGSGPAWVNAACQASPFIWRNISFTSDSRSFFSRGRR